MFRRSAEIPQTQGVPTPEVVAIHVSNVVSIQRGSELDALKKLSTLVYDTKHAANEAAALGPQAATVSPSVLLHLLSTNHGSDVGSIEGALVYEACAVENFAGYSEDVRHDCVLDKAFCNLAAMMASRVTGSVSVEVVEATNDADFICVKALRMRDMLPERWNLKATSNKVHPGFPRAVTKGTWILSHTLAVCRVCRPSVQ